MRLANKVALISGAASGMGRAAALLFASEGARLVLADWQVAPGEETAHEVERRGGRAVFVQADVSRAGDSERMVQAATASFGRLDVLYNNAGVWLEGDGPAPDLPEEVWDRVVAINLKGVYLACRYGIPAMVASGGGSIINISSVAALRAGKDHYDAYAAAKGGVIAMTRTIASTWGTKGIRANVICPGAIETPMTAASYQVPWIAEYWRTHTALGRVGQPDEVVRLALFLASDESSYLTGAVIPVDGGFTAR
jgi:NAD(P)-dependent dehydrogenase (short-subunit alcohol dehydrogenase family)